MVFSYFFDYDKNMKKYINGYIIEYDIHENYNNIINVFDIYNNDINIYDKSIEILLYKCKDSIDIHKTFKYYEYAKANMIYDIFFNEIKNLYNDNEINIKNNRYSYIRENFNFIGQQYYYDEKGNILKNFFNNNGKIEGKFYAFFNDFPEKLSHEIDYIDGKIHGYYKKFDISDGIIMQCKFIDGKINGIFTSYYKYPEIAIYCEYNNGNIIKDSFIFYSYRYFNCNFIKYIKTNFINNKENGISKIYQRMYNSDSYVDKLIEEYECKNGVYDGKYKKYDTHCRLIEDCIYSNNKRNGKNNIYEHNNVNNTYFISNENNYKNDKKHNIQKTFDEFGRLSMTEKYKRDKLINIIEYYPTGKIKKYEYYTYDYSKTDYMIEYKTVINYDESSVVISKKKYEDKIFYIEEETTYQDYIYYFCSEYKEKHMFNEIEHFYYQRLI